MFDNETINSFADQIVMAVDDIFKDKKVSQELKDYLYLVVIGMTITYGTEYIGNIYKVLTDVLFADNKIDLYSKVDKKLWPSLDDAMAKAPNSPAFTAFQVEQVGIHFNLPVLNMKYFVCINDTVNPTEILLLEFLTHELNHILMSQKNTFTPEGGSVYLRNGLFKAKLTGNSNPVGNGIGINEVINTLQTEDVIKAILQLNSYDIKNKKFRHVLDKLKNINVDNYSAVGYELLVNMFRPLYEEESVKKLFSKNVIEGNLSAIHGYFDTTLGTGAFSSMSTKLDDLYHLYVQNKIGKSISEFNFSSEVVYIRDSFIRKFLDKKFGYRNNKKVSF